MIRALLPIAALLSLVSAYHVPIPKNTKEVDGTKINVNIAIDTKTGDSVDTERNQIVGGSEVVPHSLPWQVVFMPIRCGGVIICPKYVLTAAHCTDGKEPTPGHIVAGAHNLAGKENSTTRHDIVAFYNHPDYKDIQGYFSINDYSLLELRQPITLRPEARAVYLPSRDDDKPFYEGSSQGKFLVSGWGWRLWGGWYPDRLRSVTVPSVSGKDCEAAYASLYLPNNTQYQITPNMICAGNLIEGGIDSCKGDSGGPMAWLDETSGKVKLIGLVSFGFYCARPRIPGVYARMTTVLDWVAYKTNDCNQKTCQEDNCMTKDKLIPDVVKRFRTISTGV